ncbi:uncharacterized protein LOC110239919 [Exaiptasia diaphana]|uniref:Uncharacterized protein n=1 Tax=Exaiptasia diaphana TaxID=2652724 RepID=A0A913XBA2_EXADI|nr:uncharacterized protein LOC110239919 [Exaiptasia diaphana]KXJ26563.1 hypothetical protein AC249_AIPGENE8296 [Exaiptasia diaphana]
MSSKLVKKGLDFVASTDEHKKQKGKAKKPKRGQRTRTSPYNSNNKNGKVKTKDQDFTEQNLKYFTKSTWTMKRDIYEKIVRNQGKSLRTNKDTEETEDDLEE